MITKTIFLSFMIFILSSCNDDGGGSPEVKDGLGEVFEIDPTASGQVKVGLCHEDQYAPIPDTITRKLDIIVVPDTSGSINNERSNIAKGFTSFINSLPAEIDFRIGVVLAHGPGSSHSGALFKKGSEDLVLDSQLIDTATIISGLDSKMKYPATQGSTDGGEMGVYSLTKAITDNLETIKGQGLFREDAALAIVFVADEQDICAEFPVGVIPVPDPQGKEISAYANHCVDENDELIYYPEQLLTDLENMQGDRPLVIGGVIYNNPLTVPFNGENEVGYGYKEIIEMANGISIDLASGDYGTGLTNLGKLARVSVKPESDFKINTDKVDSSTIEILVNNVPALYSFDPELNLISLTNEREPFDIVKVNYCEKAELPIEVSTIVSGGAHTCALIHDGTMNCWGDNSFGQLGYGHMDTIGDDEKPSSVAALSFGQDVVSASAGLNHTCVLLLDGSVKCFGDNSKGQLGQGHTDNLGDNETIDLIASVDLGRKATQIYSGTKYNCALLDNQKVKCWGENNFGQLGYGHKNNLGDDELLSSYGNVDLGDNAIQLDISTVSYHTCAVLKSSDGLKCWGLNSKGQLGYGHKDTLGDDEVPSSYGNVSFGNKVLQVATGFAHTCALSDGQQVRCWGANNFGQTGLGSNLTIGDDEAADSAPYLDFQSGGSSMVATGINHSCAIGMNESLYCFGRASNGQTGLGHTANIGDDESVTSNSKVEIDLALTQVVTGKDHTCTLTKDEGKVICFGLNSSGQLGIGNTTTIGDNEIPWEFVEVLPAQAP
jgi:alpha-tubulin suppressor-like RCC1 family protein